MIKAWIVKNFSDLTTQIESVNVSKNINTLDGFSLQIPSGAYTTFRTYNRVNALALEAHFSRLEETSRLGEAPIFLPSEFLRETLRTILPIFLDCEARIRLTIPFGGIDLYISCEKLKTPPPELYTKGAEVITNRMSRNNPKAKDSAFIKTTSQLKSKLQKNYAEVLMIDHNGLILEGVSSNFFAIQKGAIWTAEDDVLSGTTRTIILELIHNFGYPLQKSGYKVEELSHLDEAFISSVSRGILPIAKIDKQIIGAGTPGLITKQLEEAFDQYIQKAIKPI
jgi:branched-chain amino acid aminotransferase